MALEIDELINSGTGLYKQNKEERGGMPFIKGIGYDG